MLMQRNLILRIREVTDRVAALHLTFPKADMAYLRRIQLERFQTSLMLMEKP